MAIDKEKAEVLCRLLTETRVWAEHHYRQMVEGARLFLWAYAMIVGVSFVLLLAGRRDTMLSWSEILSLPVLWVAWVVAGVGRRVVIQQRQLFEYENRVRIAIERALGFRRHSPQMHNVTKRAWMWPTVRLSEAVVEVRYEPDDANGKVVLEPDEVERVRDVVSRTRHRGMFGGLRLLFAFALWFVPLAAIVYSLWIVRARPELGLRLKSPIGRGVSTQGAGKPQEQGSEPTVQRRDQLPQAQLPDASAGNAH
jgi:hypothetical protein